MKRIAIITLHAINNYGSVLQTFATEQLFKEFGFTPITIDYIRDTAQMNTVWKILKAKNLSITLKIKTLLVHLFSKNKKRADSFNSFRNNYLHLTDKRYLSDKDLNEDFPEADIYCTGSDQTWNVEIQGCVPDGFFLNFVPDNKIRIAFSASFGIDRLSDEYKEIVHDRLKKYKAISVREQSGLSILQYIGIKGQLVLDPTLAIDQNVWEKLAAPKMFDEDYLLAYQLNRNLKFTQYMKDFARVHNLKIVQVRARKDTSLENGICLTDATPQEWLSLIKNAKYVLTDSFHCTAYCILFHREFMCIYPPKFSTRLDSILSQTGLMERKITDFKNFSYCDKPIDFGPIDNWLMDERKKTLSFLKNALL